MNQQIVTSPQQRFNNPFVQGIKYIASTFALAVQHSLYGLGVYNPYSYTPPFVPRTKQTASMYKEIYYNRSIMEYHRALTDYRCVPMIRDAVDYIGKAVSHRPITIADNDGNALPDHPANEIFKSKSDYSLRDTLYAMYVDTQIHGNWYGMLTQDSAGVNGGLLRIPPDAVKVSFDEFWRIQQYEVESMNQIFKPFEILHMKGAINAITGNGQPREQGILSEIELYTNIVEFQGNFFTNARRPTLAIMLEKRNRGNARGTNTDMVAAQSTKEDVEQNVLPTITGDNIMVLGGNIKAMQELTFQTPETQYTDMLKELKDQIYSFYDVPPEVVSGGNTTFSNKKEAGVEVWKQSIKPFINSRDEGMTQLLRDNDLITDDEKVLTVINQSLEEKLGTAKLLKEVGFTPQEINNRLELGMEIMKEAGL